jgi:hypothetical protein
LSDLDSSVLRLTQKNDNAIRRALQDVGQVRVAELMGLSAPTLSEWKNQHLSRITAMLAACGLRVIPCTTQTFDDDYIRALRTLAQHGLSASGRAEEIE